MRMTREISLQVGPMVALITRGSVRPRLLCLASVELHHPSRFGTMLCLGGLTVGNYARSVSAACLAFYLQPKGKSFHWS